MKITVQWQVDDGYISNKRPQETEFDIEDYIDKDDWDNLSEDEKKDIILEVVEEDFRERITFNIEDFGI